jgi:hypothetical protein
MMVAEVEIAEILKEDFGSEAVVLIEHLRKTDEEVLDEVRQRHGEGCRRFLELHGSPISLA